MKIQQTHAGLAPALAALALFAGCGGSSPASPTASGTGAAAVVVTAGPIPLVAVSEPGVPARYRVTADLAFREVSGKQARITALRVTVTTPSGWSATTSTTTDVTLAPMGAAQQSLTTTIDASLPDDSARWRLVAAGLDSKGQAFDAPPVEADLHLPSRAAPAPDAVFTGAGDIARCPGDAAGATARLLDRVGGTVFTLGDNVYPRSTTELLDQCFGPTWGRHRSRMLATPGNHDWEEAAGGPYFSYFGTAAGPGRAGYYSVTLGTWHVIFLNSNIASAPGSAQYEWLKADLAASRADCTLAMWHHPLFSSGLNGNSGQMRDIWRLLNQAGADVVLNGHDHDYERFAPQDADARPSARGIREFVVGTGGAPLYDRTSQQPNSELWENRTWGVLTLTLKNGSYDWRFLPIDGQGFSDAGSAACVTP